MTRVSLSIVVSTYEWPEALDAVLRGFAGQTDQAFELIVADDGSGALTAEVVDSWRASFGDRLSHAWQDDAGFRLARVRNLGAFAARGDFFVFVDGDCVPRRGFIASIRRAALPGWFLAGKRVHLDPVPVAESSRRPCPDWPRSAASFWLRRRQIHRWADLTPRDRRRPSRSRLPDFVPHGNAYGFLMAMHRMDFEAINGFDMRYVGWENRTLISRCDFGDSGFAQGGPALDRRCFTSRTRATCRTNVRRGGSSRSTIEGGRIHAVTGIRELRAELQTSRGVAPSARSLDSRDSAKAGRRPR